MPEAKGRERATHIRGGKGQTLVIVALALPMFFAVVSLVIDGSTLMAKRRGMQNAADAASLAGAQGLPASGSCTGACQTTLKSVIEAYSQKNGGPSTLNGGLGGRCQVAADTNCYTNPYGTGPNANQLVEVRLTASANMFFTGVIGLASHFDVSARSVASVTPQLGPQVSTTPGLTHVTTDPNITITNFTTSYATTVTSNPGGGIFAYAGSTDCDAISVTHGGEDFQGGLWSNGGVKASGANNSASKVKVGNSGCQFYSQFTPPGPTPEAQRQNGGTTTLLLTNPDATHINVDCSAGCGGLFNNETIYIDSGAAKEAVVIQSISGGNITLKSPGLSTLHSPGVVVTSTDWPQDLPNPPSTCTNSGATINAAWLAANPPGVYCFTGAISLKASFTGYSFISRDSGSSQAIKCTDNGLTFIAPSTPDPDPGKNLLFYTIKGGMTFTPGGGVDIKGMMFAPNGEIQFHGGSNVQEGYMQAQKILITNGPTTFVGTGPGGGGGTSTTIGTSVIGTPTVITGGTHTTVDPDTVSTTTVIVGTTIGIDE
jgi:Flp pilus assembly protein TadG